MMKKIKRWGTIGTVVLLMILTTAMPAYAASLGFSDHAVTQYVPNQLNKEIHVPVRAEEHESFVVDFRVPVKSPMEGKTFAFRAEKTANLELERSFDTEKNCTKRDVFELAVTNVDDPSDSPDSILAELRLDNPYCAAFLYANGQWELLAMNVPSRLVKLPNPSTLVLASLPLPFPDPTSPLPEPVPSPVDSSKPIREDPIPDGPVSVKESSEPGELEPQEEIDPPKPKPTGDKMAEALEQSEDAFTSQSVTENSISDPFSPQSPGNPVPTGDHSPSAVIPVLMSTAAAAVVFAFRKTKRSDA